MKLKHLTSCDYFPKHIKICVEALINIFVIDVSLYEVELRCQPFPTGREEGLYECRFV